MFVSCTWFLSPQVGWKLLGAQHSVNTAGFAYVPGMTRFLFSGNQILLFSDSHRVGGAAEGPAWESNDLTTLLWIKYYFLQIFLIRTIYLSSWKNVLLAVSMAHSFRFLLSFQLFVNRHSMNPIWDILGQHLKPNFSSTGDTYLPVLQTLLVGWPSS